MKKINIGTIVPSLEAIDFQTDTFGKQLEILFEDLFKQNKTAKEADASKQKQLIEKLVKQRTGLAINLNLNTDQIASIYIPTFHQNHIFYNNHFRDDYKEYSKQRGEQRFLKNLIAKTNTSSVNLKTAKVTGIFGEFAYDIQISYKFFKQKPFTSAQVTAIFLHELGHLFTVLEMTSRSITTNQVLAYLCKSVLEKVTGQELKFIVEESEKSLNLKKGALEEIYEQTDPIVITTVLLKKNSEHIHSQSGLYAYDLVSCEMMADQFVARFGYGRHVIEGLDNMYKKFGITSDTRAGNKVALLADFSMNFLVWPGLIVVGLMTAAAPYAVIGAVMYLLSWLGSGSGKVDHTYDSMVTRPTRVKNDLLQTLKDKSLDKKTIDILIADIKALENLINKYEDYVPLMTRIKDYFMKSHRDARDAKMLQNDLENLAANKLFLQAAQLKTM
jgi:hypothetical protein